MLLIFKDDNTTGSFYVVYSLYIIWLLYLTRYIKNAFTYSYYMCRWCAYAYVCVLAIGSYLCAMLLPGHISFMICDYVDVMWLWIYLCHCSCHLI